MGYYYTRDSKFAANDRSNSIAGVEKPKANYKYPGFNVGGPIFFGDSYTKNKDKLFFFFGYEWQRQKIDSGSRFSRTYSPAMKNGDFSELLGQPRLEPEPGCCACPEPGRVSGRLQPAARSAENSGGLPRGRRSSAEQRHAAVHDAARHVPGKPLPRLELQRSEQSVQLRLQRARAGKPRRAEAAGRLERQQQHQGVRPDLPRSGRHRAAPRRVVGAQ